MLHKSGVKDAVMVLENIKKHIGVERFSKNNKKLKCFILFSWFYRKNANP
jgi:hypothetical protein